MTIRASSSAQSVPQHRYARPEGFPTIPGQIDFTLVNHGSLYLLRGNSVAARRWINDHIGEHQTFGRSIVVEPRYVKDLAEGIHNDGLTVEARHG